MSIRESYRLTVIIMVLFIAPSLSFGQSSSHQKDKKQTLLATRFQESKLLADSACFTFTANFANSLIASNVPLMGLQYDLQVNGDSIKVFLPYYGISRIAPAYGSGDRGIKYVGLIDDYQVKINEHKKRVIITFKSTDNNQESFKYTLFFGASGAATLSINSSHRDQISYFGDRFCPTISND